MKKHTLYFLVLINTPMKSNKMTLTMYCSPEENAFRITQFPFYRCLFIKLVYIIFIKGSEKGINTMKNIEELSSMTFYEVQYNT